MHFKNYFIFLTIFLHFLVELNSSCTKDCCDKCLNCLQYSTCISCIPCIGSSSPSCMHCLSCAAYIPCAVCAPCKDCVASDCKNSYLMKLQKDFQQWTNEMSTLWPQIENLLKVYVTTEVNLTRNYSGSTYLEISCISNNETLGKFSNQTLLNEMNNLNLTMLSVEKKDETATASNNASLLHLINFSLILLAFFGFSIFI